MCSLVINLPVLFAIALKSKKERQLSRAIEKRSHESIYKSNTKNKVKMLSAISFAIANLKEKYMGSNSEKSNIAIVIMEN